MPGGGTAKREVVEHGGAVAVVALDAAGPLDQATAFDVVDAEESASMVILIEQYRHPVGRRLWELPAGLMDVDGEPGQLAAARELMEETGYAAEHWSVLLDVATSPGFTEETVRIFLATGLTEVGRPDSEHEEADLRVVRVPLSVAVESVLAGRIVNVMAVAGILAADAVLRGSAVIVDRSDESQFDQDRPWSVYTGPGAPAAPPLDGVRSPVTSRLRACRPDGATPSRHAELDGRRCAATWTTSRWSAASPATRCCPTAETCVATWSFLASSGRTRVDEITAADVSEFLATLRGTGVGERGASGAGRFLGRPRRRRGSRLASVPAGRGHRHGRRLEGCAPAGPGPPVAEGAPRGHHHGPARGCIR